MVRLKVNQAPAVQRLLGGFDGVWNPVREYMDIIAVDLTDFVLVIKLAIFFLLVNFILVQKLAFVFIDSLYYIVTFSFY